MTALLAFLISNPTVLVVLAGIVGALGFGFQQRLAGAKAERNKVAASEVAARDIKDHVQNDIGALPPDEARKELGEWSKR